MAMIYDSKKATNTNTNTKNYYALSLSLSCKGYSVLITVIVL